MSHSAVPGTLHGRRGPVVGPAELPSLGRWGHGTRDSRTGSDLFSGKLGPATPPEKHLVEKMGNGDPLWVCLSSWAETGHRLQKTKTHSYSPWFRESVLPLGELDRPGSRAEGICISGSVLSSLLEKRLGSRIWVSQG